MLEEDDFNMLEEDEFVLLGEDDLTLAGRELRNNLNSGQRVTEVPDRESRWGEPDDDTEQNENENTEKATKTAVRAFEQWRSDTKQDTSLPCAPLSKTSRPTFRCPALLWLRAFLSCRPPRRTTLLSGQESLRRPRERRPASEPPLRSVLPANPRDHRGGLDARRGEGARGVRPSLNVYIL